MLRFLKRLNKEHDAHHDSNHQKPFMYKEITDTHDRTRDARKRSADFVKLRRKGRHDLDHHDGNDCNDDNDQDDRIDRRFHDQSLQMGFLFKLSADPVEGFIDAAGCLSRCNHMHHQLRKDFRMLGHRHRKRITFLHGVAHIRDRCGEPLVFRLLRKHV